MRVSMRCVSGLLKHRVNTLLLVIAFCLPITLTLYIWWHINIWLVHSRFLGVLVQWEEECQVHLSAALWCVLQLISLICVAFIIWQVQSSVERRIYGVRRDMHDFDIESGRWE